MRSPIATNSMALKKAWIIRWITIKEVIPIEPAVIISLNWVIVERATTFFISVSQSDLVPPIIRVKLNKIDMVLHESVLRMLITSRCRYNK